MKLTKVLFYVQAQGTDNIYSREVTVKTYEDSRVTYEFTDSKGLIHIYPSRGTLIKAMASDVQPGYDKWLCMNNELGIEFIEGTISKLEHRKDLLETLLSKEYKHREENKRDSAPKLKQLSPNEITDRID